MAQLDNAAKVKLAVAIVIIVAAALMLMYNFGVFESRTVTPEMQDPIPEDVTPEELRREQEPPLARPRVTGGA